MAGPEQKITDQMWSYIFLLTGCVMILTCKRWGIADDVGAGIVGAGINAFTSSARHDKSSNTGSGTVVQGDINLPNTTPKEKSNES